MATTAVPTPSELLPVPSLSTLGVDKLAGAPTTHNKKPGRWFKVGNDSRNINSPRSQHQLGNEAEPTTEAEALIQTVMEIGKEWQSKRKTATEYFEQHKLEVLTLRNEFGVKQGTKGELLYVPQTDGTAKGMYWSEFVLLAFGVTERHINRLLGVPVEPSTNPPDPTKSKSYKLGFAAGQETALRGQVQAPAVAQPVSKLDKHDPYAYFEQLKDEKQSFAYELAAMLVEIYDPTDAEEVVKAFTREVKRQLDEVRKESIKATKD